MKNPRELDNNQIPTNYTPHKFETKSRMNSIYQNTTNKVSPTKEKIWSILLLLESPKNKNFQSTVLKIGFLLTLAQNKIFLTYQHGMKTKNFHQNFSPSKRSSKLANAQFLNSTNYGKQNYFLLQLKQWNKTNFHTNQSNN